MSELITQEDLIELFGEAMPIEAVNLLWNCPGEWTLGRLRSELRKIAKARIEKDALVGRLRREAVNWSASCGKLFGEAADRIMVLEAALHDIGRCTDEGNASQEVADIIDAVLGTEHGK